MKTLIRSQQLVIETLRDEIMILEERKKAISDLYDKQLMQKIRRQASLDLLQRKIDSFNELLSCLNRTLEFMRKGR